jgi:hypothetical protein
MMDNTRLDNLRGRFWAIETNAKIAKTLLDSNTAPDAHALRRYLDLAKDLEDRARAIRKLIIKELNKNS